MTEQSVNEPSFGINQDKLNEVLSKSEAMLQIVLNSDFKLIPDYLMYDYLWALSDLITGARKFLG